MLGRVLNPKYSNSRSLVANIHINKTLISKTLIDLGASINVMTRDMMLKLNLQNSLRHTTIILQLIDSSIVSPKGILEDVIVFVDSSEYLVDFILLETKAKISGYPLILGKPWLATIDAYVGCRERDMTITNGPY